jgi:mannose-6-phosphate isomerase-like protein (cupin superfamily)
MANEPSRRSFLRTAPLAVAAAGLALNTAPAVAEAAQESAAPEHFQLFTAGKLADATQHLQSAPGNDNLFTPAALPFTVVLTTEKTKAAKEFEWHEGRDHILQILDGSAIYEVGGTPQGGHNTKPGEWLAPASTDATKLTLNKGDMLIIPRGTPHKRTTPESVTFYLISTTGK